jgi:hypothetical protein
MKTMGEPPSRREEDGRTPAIRFSQLKSASPPRRFEYGLNGVE